MIIGKKLGSPGVIFNLIKSYLILYLLAIPIINYAQTFEWINPYPVNFNYNPDFLNYAVSADNSNNVYWAGMFMFHENYGNTAYGDMVIRKHDAMGNQIYYFYAYGEANIVNMLHDGEDNLILIIDIREDILLDTSDTLFHSGDNVSSHLVKLSPDFNLLWTKMIADDFSYSVHKGFTIDQENNIYYGYNNFQNSELIILNPDGDEIAGIVQQNVGVISSVDIDNDGNIYTTGSCASPGASYGGVVFEPPLNYNLYIAKYDSQMEVQWVNYVEDVTCPFPEVIVTDPDHVYFVGELYLSTMFGNIMVNGPDWVFDYFVAKLNADGDFVWVNEVPDMDTIAGDASVGKFNSCTIDSENNLCMTGFIRGDIDWGNGMVTTSTNIGYDLLVVKYNEDGDIILTKTGGGESYDKAISSAIGPSDDLYIAGYGFDSISFDTLETYFDGYYPFLVKLNSGDIATGVTNDFSEEIIHVYPNPVSDILSVDLNKFETDQFQLWIQDINGAILTKIESRKNDNLQIDFSHYESGIYFLSIFSEGENFQRNKIIKL